jgi:hypothetical protein
MQGGPSRGWYAGMPGLQYYQEQMEMMLQMLENNPKYNMLHSKPCNLESGALAPNSHGTTNQP